MTAQADTGAACSGLRLRAPAGPAVSGSAQLTTHTTDTRHGSTAVPSPHANGHRGQGTQQSTPHTSQRTVDSHCSRETAHDLPLRTNALPRLHPDRPLHTNPPQSRMCLNMFLRCPHLSHTTAMAQAYRGLLWSGGHLDGDRCHHDGGDGRRKHVGGRLANS